MLRDRNTETYIVVKVKVSEKLKGYMVMQQAFLQFGAYIDAFCHCHPLMSVDGTFLTGKYKGQILTAISVDANNQILPVVAAL